jgi:hypothetical protein
MQASYASGGHEPDRWRPGQPSSPTPNPQLRGPDAGPPTPPPLPVPQRTWSHPRRPFRILVGIRSTATPDSRLARRSLLWHWVFLVAWRIRVSGVRYGRFGHCPQGDAYVWAFHALVRTADGGTVHEVWGVGR